MAQSITCPECSAVLKSPTPVPAGKKIKCPKCGTPFVTPGAEASEADTVQIPPPESAAAGDEPAPAKKGKGKTGASTADEAGGEAGPPRKKSKALLFGLIGGGVLLLSCCCAGVGGAGALYWLGSRGMETAVVGTWFGPNKNTVWVFHPDGKLKRQGFDLVYKLVDPKTLEIGPDKQGDNMLNGKPYPTIRYRVTFTAPNAMTLDEVSVRPEGPPEQVRLKRG